MYDVIGIGLGPANLALLTAFEERRLAGQPAAESLVLETRDEFVWHLGMLLPRARCQVSFLKDLATMRDPTSPFTFANYLHHRGRLAAFANLRDPMPSRVEFNDYLRWVADRVDGRVRYGAHVERVEPEYDAGEVTALRVVARDTTTARRHTYLTRHLVVGTGAAPFVPTAADGVDSPRVFHSSRFRPAIGELLADPAGKYEVTVVGAGQSAADIVAYLLERYPNIRVCLVMRQFGLRPLDESPFTNELFAPDMLGRFYDMPPELQARLLREHRNAAYAIVDEQLVTSLYAQLYQDRVAGEERLRLLSLHELVGVAGVDDGARVDLRDLSTGAQRSLHSTAVVLATGYRQRRRLPMLEPVERYLARDAAGDYLLGREFDLRTQPGFRPAIFLQGFGEDTHGLGEAQLSNMAIRAGLIADRIHGRLTP